MLDISSYRYKRQGELYFVYHKAITDVNTAWTRLFRISHLKLA